MAEIQLKNIDEAVTGWADVVIDRFKEALKKYGVEEYSRELIERIATELKRSNDNIDTVMIRMVGYGRMVDMGVGRGVAIGRRGTEAFSKSRREDGKLKQYGRKPKPFYSKTKTREVAILRELLVKEYGVNTLAELESGLTFTHTETLS